MDIEPIRQKLLSRKGTWPAIAIKAGISYSTLCKFADGRTKCPAFHTLNKLRVAMK